MSNTSLSQQIAILKTHYASGVLQVKNGETMMTFRSLAEMEQIIAKLEAELETQLFPTKRRVRMVRVNGRGGW